MNNGEMARLRQKVPKWVHVRDGQWVNNCHLRIGGNLNETKLWLKRVFGNKFRVKAYEFRRSSTFAEFRETRIRCNEFVVQSKLSVEIKKIETGRSRGMLASNLAC